MRQHGRMSVRKPSRAFRGIAWLRNFRPENRPTAELLLDSLQVADIADIRGERVQVHCYTMGDAVGSYGNRIWYQVDNLSRPTAAGRANSGFVNTHYVDDGMTANNAASGIPAC
jgi:hypothetical protein